MKYTILLQNTNLIRSALRDDPANVPGEINTDEPVSSYVIPGKILTV